MLAARLPAVPAASAVQGSQPDRRPARRSASRTSEATISTAVDRQRERVGVPAGLAVVLGELAHVAVAEGAGDAGQAGDGGRRNAADPPVGRPDLHCSACWRRANESCRALGA